MEMLSTSFSEANQSRFQWGSINPRPMFFIFPFLFRHRNIFPSSYHFFVMRCLTNKSEENDTKVFSQHQTNVMLTDPFSKQRKEKENEMNPKESLMKNHEKILLI